MSSEDIKRKAAERRAKLLARSSDRMGVIHNRTFAQPTPDVENSTAQQSQTLEVC